MSHSCVSHLCPMIPSTLPLPIPYGAALTGGKAGVFTKMHPPCFLPDLASCPASLPFSPSAPITVAIFFFLFC